MVNGNLAIHSTAEIKKKKVELESKWELFVSNNQKPDKIRSEIYQSWKRSQSYGVNPRQKRSSVTLPNDELSELLHKSKLYNISVPILNELEKQTRGTEHLITLCDNKGRIIYLQGDDHVLRKAEEMNFVLGADWSEKTAGSNAIGTCIAMRKPIQVFAQEHYCEGVHPWTCSAAPIKDPLTGELLGVFDLTGPSDLAQPHSLGLAQSFSVFIQQGFTNISRKIRRRLEECFEYALKRWKYGATIVLDAALNPVAADQKCLSLLKIEDWRQLWFHSELERLKGTILNSNDKEMEIYLASLQLTVFIQKITMEMERIGFLLHFDKKQTSQPRQSNVNSSWDGLIGRSKALEHVIRQAQIAAPTNVPILLTGESGTGKEQFAQGIHKASLRHQFPFLAMNCGAVPKELMASELFGYEPGAFTGSNPKGKKGIFEKAQGGTLFLDEIGEMPRELQVHLLRVLQEMEVVRIGSAQPIPIDVRIIAATNKNLNDLIDQGYFRMDLYFRINVVELKLPPLRERKEDIVSLCHYFIKKNATRLGKPIPTIDDQVISCLQQHHWPGNIRELENAIKHAVLFCKNNHITLSSLPDSLQIYELERNNQELGETLTPLEQEEKKKIRQMLTETRNNLSEVARQLGIARTTLYRKLNKYHLR